MNNSMDRTLKFVEIGNIDDDLLLPWFDLYETAFPPQERVLISSFLQLLKDKASGKCADSYVVAVRDNMDNFVGMLRYDMDSDSGFAYLWYLAVVPNSRNSGYGSSCYNHILQRAKECGMRGVLFEVEIPELCSNSVQCELAQRRIAFYRRSGARMLTGIHYMQSVGPHQPPMPMHIMIGLIEPLSAQQSFEVAKMLLGDAVTQIAELSLD